MKKWDGEKHYGENSKQKYWTSNKIQEDKTWHLIIDKNIESKNKNY
jgi:hypothetical protein